MAARDAHKATQRTVERCSGSLLRPSLTQLAPPTRGAGDDACPSLFQPKLAVRKAIQDAKLSYTYVVSYGAPHPPTRLQCGCSALCPARDRRAASVGHAQTWPKKLRALACCVPGRCGRAGPNGPRGKACAASGLPGWEQQAIWPVCPDSLAASGRHGLLGATASGRR